MLKGSSGRPDILVLEPNVSPVVIETEVLPATSVEDEARSRLGSSIRSTGQTILSSIAVKMPTSLRALQAGKLTQALLETDHLEFALYTGRNMDGHCRWPTSGWIMGGVSDLSLMVQSATVPPDIVDEAADYFSSSIMEAADLLESMSGVHPGTTHRISGLLHQEYDSQTRRMAMAILANAFVFHDSLSRGPGELQEVRALEELRGSDLGLCKSSVLEEWRKILLVDYWPIFDIARRLLEVIPADGSSSLLDIFAKTADKLLSKSLMRSHDLTGAVFQRLIADRKVLAAFYTKPASAELLIGLALDRGKSPSGASWRDSDSIRALRIADFACGTGTLLSTAYRQIGQLHELEGGNTEVLHEDMMASSLVGCDVLPAAAHLTASMLSSAHPMIKYAGSSILTVPYGIQTDGSVALGSLDLLNSQGVFEILSITAQALEGTGPSERETWDSLPHNTFDLVVMNPPFVRATNHEGKRSDVPNPMFAAFGADADAQRLMSDATRRLTKGTSAHGNAGEASIFLVLADQKLKPGGTLAMVLPLTLLSGFSWEKSRQLLSHEYDNLIVVSIAGCRNNEMAFSADTGMAECLIVATKEKAAEQNRGTFVSLRSSPEYQIVGSTLAREIRRQYDAGTLRRLEDGPIGGTPLEFGNDIVGQAIDAPLPISGGWRLSRIHDYSIAQCAYQIVEENRIWLPSMQENDAIPIPMTTLSSIGEVGPIDRDINGKNSDGSIRGPFEIRKLTIANQVPTYPILWAHDASRERTLAFDADSEGIPLQVSDDIVKRDIQQKVKDVYLTASHCHANRDFRFNSQSTAMQFTPRETIGGRAWPSIKLADAAQEKALVLWANSSLGILMYWWHSTRQQAGRGTITKARLATLPVFDVTRLSKTQISNADALFKLIKDKHLKPIHQIAQDPIRNEIDCGFYVDVLGIEAPILGGHGPLDILKRKMAQEPSIRGSK